MSRYSKQQIKDLLTKRPEDGHKGTFGHVLNISGSAGMGGAVYLSSYSALKTGAGRVTAAVPKCLENSFISIAPEIMTLSIKTNENNYFTQGHFEFLRRNLKYYDVFILGCGLSFNILTSFLVRNLISQIKSPLILDADALNYCTHDILHKVESPIVITPHPKEFSRISGLSLAEIQSNRLEICMEYSKKWNLVILLKGKDTVIAAPNGSYTINSTGNEGMATAGSGDVLTGMIAGFLAQGMELFEAAVAGAYIHGLSGDLKKDELTSYCLTATDIIDGLPLAFRVVLNS